MSELKDLKIEEDGNIALNIYALLENTDKDTRLALAKALCWGEVLMEAANRLIDFSGNWASDDWKDKLAFVNSVEEKLISGYRYTVLEEIKRLMRGIKNHNELYWKLYHHAGPIENSYKWLKEMGIESNYTSEYPECDKIEELVTKMLKEAAEGIKALRPKEIFVDEQENKIRSCEDGTE